MPEKNAGSILRTRSVHDALIAYVDAEVAYRKYDALPYQKGGPKQDAAYYAEFDKLEAAKAQAYGDLGLQIEAVHLREVVSHLEAYAGKQAESPDAQESFDSTVAAIMEGPHGEVLRKIAGHLEDYSRAFEAGDEGRDAITDAMVEAVGASSPLPPSIISLLDAYCMVEAAARKAEALATARGDASDRYVSVGLLAMGSGVFQAGVILCRAIVEHAAK